MTTRPLAPGRPGPARPLQRGGRASRLVRSAGAAWRLLAQHPGTVLTGVVIVAGGGLFAWNALVTQPTRHPAPLFAKERAAAMPAEPPRRPDITTTASAAPRPEAAPIAAKPIPEPRPRAMAPPSDPIGALIKGADAAGKAPEAKVAEVKVPQPRVLTAQKALAKLGYGPIAADGLFGSSTRQALERFERDRNIPVTGALGPRTVKVLASRSGLQVE